MYPLLKKAYAPHRNSISLYSNLLNHCFSLQSLDSAKVIHAQLIKIGLNSHTFLSSRCVDLYSHFGNVNDVLKAFDEIDNKNVISWNICLKALLEFGRFSGACHLFDEMPDKDVVSWNSMISGCASYGFVDDAFEYFSEMQDVGVKADEFTFTILLSFTSSMLHVKQIHAKVIRNGMNLSNVVLGNSLIDLYGKVRMIDYAFGVFWMMKKRDIISWNSLILSCHKSGYGEFALHQFLMMRSAGHSPDQFTISTAVTVCSNLQDLEKDWEIPSSYSKK